MFSRYSIWSLPVLNQTNILSFNIKQPLVIHHRAVPPPTASFDKCLLWNWTARNTLLLPQEILSTTAWFPGAAFVRRSCPRHSRSFCQRIQPSPRWVWELLPPCHPPSRHFCTGHGFVQSVYNNVQYKCRSIYIIWAFICAWVLFISRTYLVWYTVFVHCSRSVLVLISWEWSPVNCNNSGGIGRIGISSCTSAKKNMKRQSFILPVTSTTKSLFWPQPSTAISDPRHLKANEARLLQLLKYHTVRGVYPSSVAWCDKTNSWSYKMFGVVGYVLNMVWTALLNFTAVMILPGRPSAFKEWYCPYPLLKVGFPMSWDYQVLNKIKSI